MGMAPSAGTVAHALILPKGGDGALAKVVAHAHVKPCAQGKGGGHWMHDATKAKSDTSNKLYVLGPVGRWYKTMAAWKVNSQRHLGRPGDPPPEHRRARPRYHGQGPLLRPCVGDHVRGLGQPGGLTPWSVARGRRRRGL